MSRRFTLLAVTLPVLAIVFGIVRAELFMRHAHEYVFEITGYDPRDLLRGHYLQFQLAIDPLAVREPCEDGGDEACCFCLTRTDGGASLAERATCATARTDCDGLLQTSIARAQIRYFVPEEQAVELERRLREAMARRSAFAVMAVDDAGAAQVVELRIDGEVVPGGVSR